MRTSEETNTIISKLDTKLNEGHKFKDWKLLLLQLASGDVLLRQDSQVRRWYRGEPSELDDL